VKVEFGPATFEVPDGWNETGREGERLTFLHDDKLEHVTISYRHFRGTIVRRVRGAVRAEARDRARRARRRLSRATRSHPDRRRIHARVLRRRSLDARMFSGLLIVIVDTLLAIYVEGFDLEPARHQTFAAFAQGWSSYRGPQAEPARRDHRGRQRR